MYNDSPTPCSMPCYYYEIRFYIPAASWQGSKPGYYFGTADTELGTGYYLDILQQQKLKKACWTVGFAQEKNKTKLIPSRSSTTSGELLLQHAEEQALAKGGCKVVALTASGVKAAALALRRAVETNALQRFEATTTTTTGAAVAAESYYVESEVALYEHVVALKAFAADPAALYPVLLAHDVVQNLVQLLLHDNVDVAVAVCSVLVEWLDSDLLLALDDDEDDEDSPDGRQAAVLSLACTVLDQGAELLVENLARMQGNNDDDDDDDNENDVGRGVLDILSLLENLLDMDVLGTGQGLTTTTSKLSVAATLCKETALVSWLFAQLANDNDNNAYQN